MKVAVLIIITIPVILIIIIIINHQIDQAGEARSLRGGFKTTSKSTFAITQTFESASILEVIINLIHIIIIVFTLMPCPLSVCHLCHSQCHHPLHHCDYFLTGHQQLPCPGTPQLAMDSLLDRNTSHGLLARWNPCGTLVLFLMALFYF